MLVVLRPLPPAEEKRHPFSNAVYRMRECLSNFTAVQFRMKRVLQEHHLLGGLEQDLANQSRLIYQMLRLTRQAELTQELNDKAFPREEGFDLAMVCQGMADEATWLADLAGVRFTYTSNVEHLPFQGSKSLLTQMLLQPQIRTLLRLPTQMPLQPQIRMLLRLPIQMPLRLQIRMLLRLPIRMLLRLNNLLI